MQKILVLNLIALTFLITSCASHQKGNYAHITTGKHPGPMPITAFIDESKSTQHFKLVNIQFKNESNDWVRVNTAKIKKLNNKNIISVTQGDDIKEWMDSFVEYKNIENYNKTMSYMAVVGIGTVGLLAAAVSGDEALAATSIGAVQGASVGTTVEAIDDSKDELESARLLEENHLYHQFSVAPGMVKKRWVLVQVPRGKKLTYIDFEIQYDEDQKVQYNASLEEKSSVNELF